jgi:hypothetical protein
MDRPVTLELVCRLSDLLTGQVMASETFMTFLNPIHGQTCDACVMCRLSDLLTGQVMASETFMTFLLLWTVFFNFAHIF